MKISKRNSGAFKPGPDICLQRDPVGQLLTDKRTFIKHARFCLMQAEVVIVIKKKKKRLVTRNTSLVLKSGEEEYNGVKSEWERGTSYNKIFPLKLWNSNKSTIINLCSVLSRSRSVGSVFGNIPKLIGHIKW